MNTGKICTACSPQAGSLRGKNKARKGEEEPAFTAFNFESVSSNFGCKILIGCE